MCGNFKQHRVNTDIELLSVDGGLVSIKTD